MAYPLFLAKLLIRTGVARFLPGVWRRLDGGADFLRYCSDRLLMAPLDDLDEVGPALDPEGPEVIDLTPGAPHFDLLPTGSTKLPADRRGWPPPLGLSELRAAIAEKLRADNGLTLDPADEVLVTAGALGALQTVADAFVNRGDRVVLPDPTAPLFPLVMRARGARISWLPTCIEDGRTRFRLDHLARALRGARLLVLSSPANPTGGIIAPEDLEQVAWWAERHDVLMLSDESFDRYHYEGELVSPATLPRARLRTLTVGSVSKGHALAAARVGWLAAHRHLLRPCLATAALRSPFVPTLCQQIALAALRTPPEAFTPFRSQFAARRRYAFERLQAVDRNPAWPAGAFFLWMPVWELGMRGREFADDLLQSRRVRVTPGHLFGPSGAGHVRLSYAVDDGRLQEGLNRLSEFVRGLTGTVSPPHRQAA